MTTVFDYYSSVHSNIKIRFNLNEAAFHFLAKLQSREKPIIQKCVIP